MNSKIFQVLTLTGLACASLISATVEITASYTGQDGNSFKIGSNATFNCTIRQYSGVQIWKVDNIPVASCDFVDCEQNTSNPDRYLFMPDLSAGIFIFTISLVEHADDGKAIECFGGSDTDKKTLTMVVTDISSNNENACSWLCIIGIIIGAVIAIACITGVIIFKTSKPGAPTEFSVIGNGITETSISVAWKPGRSVICGLCGLKQKFILSRKKLKQNNQKEEEEAEENEQQHTTEHTQTSFENLTKGTYYRLNIYAVNCIGTSPASKSLQERTKGEPDPPTEFTLIDGSVTETCIGFKWKPGFDGGSPQTFILTYKVNGQAFPRAVKDSGQDQMQHTLRDLSKGTYYSVTIFAQNRVGQSSLVDPLYVRTKGDGVPYQPTDFRINKVTRSSVIVHWKPGNNGGYDQEFLLNNSENKNVVTIEDEHAPLMSYAFQKLSLTKNCQLIIRARNEKGSTPPVSVWTKSKPNKPTDFKHDENSKTESSITVKWKPGFDGGFPQTFILCYEGNGNIGRVSVPDEAGQDAMTHTFENLATGTYYTIRIFATNQKGDSLQPDPLVVKTKGIPNKPADFKLDENSVTESSITVKWKPGFDGGFPQTFILSYEGNGNTGRVRVPDETREDTMTHTFENLAKGTKYTISILATNQEGDSLHQDPIVVKTKGKPNKPTDFKLDENSVTESSITVEWKPGFDGGFPQTFILRYEGNGNTDRVSVPDETRQHTMTHTFENLAKGTKYTISIFATNQEGDSLQPDPLVVKTKDKFQHAALPNIYEMGTKGVQLPVSEREHEHKKISKHFPEELRNVASASNVIIDTNNKEFSKSNNSTTADRKTVLPSNTAGVSSIVRNTNSSNSGARHTDSSSRPKKKKTDKRSDTMSLSANFTDNNDNTPEVSGDSSETSKGEYTSM